jgi:hypothetical protein
MNNPLHLVYNATNRRHKREAEREAEKHLSDYEKLLKEFYLVLFSRFYDHISYKDLYSEFLLIHQRMNEYKMLQKQFKFTAPNATWLHDLFKPLEREYTTFLITKHIRDAYFRNHV